MHTIRETGDNQRPTPRGEFTGVTRAQMMRDLLAAKAPEGWKSWPWPRGLGLLTNPIVRALMLLTLLTATAITPASAQSIKVTGTVIRLTPAQAAQILLGGAMLANRTTVPVSPAPPSIIVPSIPGAAYWMPMPPTSEPRRLDGTLLSQPLQVYGPQNVIIVQDQTPARNK